MGEWEDLKENLRKAQVFRPIGTKAGIRVATRHPQRVVEKINPSQLDGRVVVSDFCPGKMEKAGPAVDSAGPYTKRSVGDRSGLIPRARSIQIWSLSGQALPSLAPAVRLTAPVPLALPLDRQCESGKALPSGRLRGRRCPEMAENQKPASPQGSNPSTPVKHRPYFTSKSGKRFYAKDYGYSSWPIGRSGSGRK